MALCVGVLAAKAQAGIDEDGEWPAWHRCAVLDAGGRAEWDPDEFEGIDEVSHARRARCEAKATRPAKHGSIGACRRGGSRRAARGGAASGHGG